MTTLHVLPVDDLIDHADSDDCICGPTIEPIQHDDGTIDWLVVHHSLDGRENHETEPEKPRRDWWEAIERLVVVAYMFCYGFLWGAIAHPSHEFTLWFLIAISIGWLAWLVVKHIHTRRNR